MPQTIEPFPGTRVPGYHCVALRACGHIQWLGIATLVHQSQLIMEQGQITDRFTKAIEQLGAIDASGKKKLEVRLGGIYALERIAHDSERDHWPVMEVLCAYVRENAPTQMLGIKRWPDADIQAILTVIRRRDHKHERENQFLNLSSTHLMHADLTGTDLSGADFSCANLELACLNDSKLTGANLAAASLTGAKFARANLERTCLLTFA